MLAWIKNMKNCRMKITLFAQITCCMHGDMLSMFKHSTTTQPKKVKGSLEKCYLEAINIIVFVTDSNHHVTRRESIKQIQFQSKH